MTGDIGGQLKRYLGVDINPASISTCTTALCPFRDARCNALCLSTVSPRRLDVSLATAALFPGDRTAQRALAAIPL